MLWSVLIRSDERQIDRSFHLGRQFDLGFFSGFFESLQSHWIFANVDAFFLAEFLADKINEALIEIIATEMSVSIGCKHFEDAIADIENGNVECPAAEIKDGDTRILALFQAVGECRSGWFVDDSLDFKSSNFSSVFCCLTLRIVEISRHSDHSTINFFAEIFLSNSFQIAQNHCGNFWWREDLAANVHLDQIFRATCDGVRNSGLLFFHFRAATAHKALDREDRVLGIGDLLMSRGLTHQLLTLFGEADDGWSRAISLRVDENLGLSALHN